MSILNSPQYQSHVNDYDYDEMDDFYEENSPNKYTHSYDVVDDSEGNDSDTEEASESEYGRSGRAQDEPLEIKEQMYHDKLANLKKQLEELKSNTHSEYVRRLRKLESQYKERLRLNEVFREYSEESIENDFVMEKKSAVKEYEDKRNDLKENLITDLEEKRKNIENERHTMELTGDSTETKPTVTRKLRRRPNDPVPVTAEKRRKPTVGQLTLLLDDKDIESDLKAISRGKTTPVRPTQSNNNGASPSGASSLPGNSSTSSNENYPLVETRVEDGKLLYERRWFHRGQPVYIEGKDVAQFPANISAIGNDVIWVKKLNDNNKIKILTSHLSRGKIAIKRRAN